MLLSSISNRISAKQCIYGVSHLFKPFLLEVTFKLGSESASCLWYRLDKILSLFHAPENMRYLRIMILDRQCYVTLCRTINCLGYSANSECIFFKIWCFKVVCLKPCYITMDVFLYIRGFQATASHFAAHGERKGMGDGGWGRASLFRYLCNLTYQDDKSAQKKSRRISNAARSLSSRLTPNSMSLPCPWSILDRNAQKRNPRGNKCEEPEQNPISELHAANLCNIRITAENFWNDLTQEVRRSLPSPYSQPPP